jgi:predicted secreted protein
VLLSLGFFASCNIGHDAPGQAGAAVPTPVIVDASHAQHAREQVLDVDVTKAGAPIRIVVGQTLRIRLPASPASGDDWTLDGDLPAFLRVETAPGLEPVQSSAPRIVQAWSFRARQRGHGQVRFLRRHPWDADAATTRRETLDIVVD